MAIPDTRTRKESEYFSLMIKNARELTYNDWRDNKQPVHQRIKIRDICAVEYKDEFYHVPWGSLMYENSFQQMTWDEDDLWIIIDGEKNQERNSLRFGKIFDIFSWDLLEY